MPKLCYFAKSDCNGANFALQSAFSLERTEAQHKSGPADIVGREYWLITHSETALAQQRL